jgi:AmmeMemoRadiSam system protein A
MTAPARLETAERAALLGIARRAILAHLGLTSPPPFPASGPLCEVRGAFVTLHVDGQLRGCIGSFRPEGSLAATVARMAISAATEDPRFEPIGADDVPALRIGISALRFPRALADRSELEVGRHGLLVRKGFHRGTLLPKVAVEHGWNAEEFLKHACLKAGLHARAHLDADVVVEVFEAEEFEE